ncbi:hypothetical protein HBH56_140430 [Parastagonospora nodorum]|uniref:Ecp2 effector protein domain-containing protein n=2 Tax=Phaeosphaeria nodorum (strain SN15 / ATCC MYA-4574 / FGSC 10173) TaxID=321614 RepID=A0A7U2ER53_PHANO|nr:hypothetical protein HBH56_140430 [Parastagonospora nodorum]QRC91553.1 hypothetical protein JI435_427010 [Parastagonospora nodorum SN15]KAH3928043.1 hypothetical protein HBH54_145570 [Parastagonospora nodorum]KAH3949052.1 hypothetical protein HBH53_095570 [Parastagonospora nodorum]KAH3983366.1 hypothetical protein HBH51_032590 [Parastagonospora nodorum]
MRITFYTLLCLTAFFTILVGAGPNLEDRSSGGLQLSSLNTSKGVTSHASGDDPSLKYDSSTTIQIWVGSIKIAVGHVIQADLYRTIWSLLDRACPSNTDQATCKVDKTDICFKTVTIGKDKRPVDSMVCIHEIRAEWGTEELRKLLIGVVAGTLEALTKRYPDGKTNCFWMGDEAACNVGDVVRTNLVPYGTKAQYFHIKLWNGETGYGQWDCCEGDKLQLVDKAVDGLGSKIGEIMHQEFTRNSACITDGWKGCKKAYEKFKV